MTGSTQNIYRPIKIQEQNILDELQGVDVVDVTAIAREVADASISTNYPLRIARVDSETGLAVLVTANNVNTLLIKYQPQARNKYYAGNYLIFTRPIITLVIPNFALFDVKILQPFYAKNLAKVTIRCKIQQQNEHNAIFAKQELERYYSLQELIQLQIELAKIINDEKYYNTHPDSAPPPKHLP